MNEPLVTWSEANDGYGSHWQLRVGGRIAAIVYENGVWHTFDQEGVGGENDREDTIESAKVEAAASAIAQGFI